MGALWGVQVLVVCALGVSANQSNIVVMFSLSRFTTPNQQNQPNTMASAVPDLREVHTLYQSISSGDTATSMRLVPRIKELDALNGIVRHTHAHTKHTHTVQPTCTHCVTWHAPHNQQWCCDNSQAHTPSHCCTGQRKRGSFVSLMHCFKLVLIQVLEAMAM